MEALKGSSRTRQDEVEAISTYSSGEKKKHYEIQRDTRPFLRIVETLLCVITTLATHFMTWRNRGFHYSYPCSIITLTIIYVFGVWKFLFIRKRNLTRYHRLRARRYVAPFEFLIDQIWHLRKKRRRPAWNKKYPDDIEELDAISRRI